MTAALRDAVSSELVKLRGLPSAVIAMLVTVATAIGLAAGVAASAPDAATVRQIVSLTIPFLQIGTVVVGVLTASSEYTGSQSRTSLLAIPSRPLLLVAKAIAYLSAATITSTAAVGSGVAVADLFLTLRGFETIEPVLGWPAVGAIAYLVLIGLLGFALAILLRSMMLTLVISLSLVLVVPQLVAAVSEHARWLPDQAGRLLYLPDTDALLTAGTGSLVLLAWVFGAGVLATSAFLVRDA